MKTDNFKQWLEHVNFHLETQHGLSSEDLPDCCYRDWHDEGVTPLQAAKRAIRNAKES